MQYKTQIHSSLEYSCLAWSGGCQYPVRAAGTGTSTLLPYLLSLQHRWEVVGLNALYSVQQMRVEHLKQSDELRSTPARRQLLHHLCLCSDAKLCTTKDSS